MRGIIDRLADAGIHTLVEFHQDIFSSRFCGEGFPAWLFDDDTSATTTAADAAIRHPESATPDLTGDSTSRGLEEVATTAPVSWDEPRRSTIRQLLRWRRPARAAGSAATVTVYSDDERPEAGSTPRSSNRPTRKEQAELGSTSVRLPPGRLLPCWGAICGRPAQYAATFPEPLGRKFGTEGDGAAGRGAAPPESKCLSMSWDLYHFTFAVARGFQDLYSNRWGWSDLFEKYWSTVSGAMAGQRGVLGYEIINEPWAGDQYHNPLVLLPGYADRWNFLPLYDRVAAAIRRRDPARLLFFESLTFDNVHSGFARVPGGAPAANLSVLSYHFYRPPNLDVRQAFAERAQEAARLRCASFLTEFGIMPLRPAAAAARRGSGPLIIRDSHGTDGARTAARGAPGAGSQLDFSLEVDPEDVMAAADAHVQSWIGWEYKPYVGKTGFNSGPFQRDGTLDLQIARSLARTYPRAVAGSITTFSFDPATALFSLSFVAGPTRGDGGGRRHSRPALSDPAGLTEIWFHREYFYPFGLLIDAQPVGQLNTAELDNLILVRHDRACEGKPVTVRISPRPAPPPGQ